MASLKDADIYFRADSYDGVIMLVVNILITPATQWLDISHRLNGLFNF